MLQDFVDKISSTILRYIHSKPNTNAKNTLYIKMVTCVYKRAFLVQKKEIQS